jgi:stress-induced morphogen
MIKITTFGDDVLKDLGRVGIVSELEFKTVPETKLFRMTVTSPNFKKLRYSERQELVWRVVAKNLSPADQLHILSIKTNA